MNTDYINFYAHYVLCEDSHVTQHTETMQVDPFSFGNRIANNYYLLPEPLHHNDELHPHIPARFKLPLWIGVVLLLIGVHHMLNVRFDLCTS